MRPRCHEQAVPLSVPWLTHTHAHNNLLPKQQVCSKETFANFTHYAFFKIYKHDELTENNI